VSKLTAGMPVEGPMKVNLRIDKRGYQHRLHINVKMTRRDWDAIGRAGLLNHSLFEKEEVTSTTNYYAIAHLLRITHVDFDNYINDESAKEEIVPPPQALRSRIKQKHEIARRPQEQQETLEI